MAKRDIKKLHSSFNCENIHENDAMIRKNSAAAQRSSKNYGFRAET